MQEQSSPTPARPPSYLDATAGPLQVAAMTAGILLKNGHSWDGIAAAGRKSVARWSAPFLYLPFCFFNIASPVLTVLYGFSGFKIERLDPVAGLAGANGLSSERG